jgi:hypothetical protein
LLDSELDTVAGQEAKYDLVIAASVGELRFEEIKIGFN